MAKCVLMRKPLSYLPILLCNVTKGPHLCSRSCVLCATLRLEKDASLDAVWGSKNAPRLASQHSHAAYNRVASRFVRALAPHFLLPRSPASLTCRQSVSRHVLLMFETFRLSEKKEEKKKNVLRVSNVRSCGHYSFETAEATFGITWIRKSYIVT